MSNSNRIINRPEEIRDNVLGQMRTPAQRRCVANGDMRVHWRGRTLFAYFVTPTMRVLATVG